MNLVLPAEWAPQACVQLTWPRPGGDFTAHLPAVEHCFVDIAVAIAQRQMLIVACGEGCCCCADADMHVSRHVNVSARRPG